MALFEVVGQEREPDEEAKEIGKDHPLVPEMKNKTADAGAGVEPSPGDLIDRDRAKADQCCAKRVVMKQRDAQQGQPEQDKIDGYMEDVHCRNRPRLYAPSRALATEFESS